jgi:hypothetical protein
MRGSVKDSSYVSGLLDLHRLKQGDRRATWRQSMAALARAVSEEGPGPLDGLHPEALLLGVRAALGGGFADDLDWLAPSKAGAALYELASALPIGAEKRELGRRVLARLLEGNAEVFVTIATRMALGSGKGLGTPAVRARVALVTELPISVGIADGALALAFAQRRDLARDWIDVASTGSLPARRLSARLLERAAREATRRASQGDPHGLRAFKVDAVGKAYQRLLADRESLVWRHVAVARGLLAPYVPTLAQELEASLGTQLSPTEWRRGATSIAAWFAVDPDHAGRVFERALGQGLVERDPGVAAAFVWGVPRAVEAEPEVAEEVLRRIVDKAPAGVAEAVVEIAAELGNGPVVEHAAAKVVQALARHRSQAHGDDGADALAHEIMRDLDKAPRDDQPVRQQLGQALAAFATGGARAAYAAARSALSATTGAMEALQAVGTGDVDEGRAGSLARRTSLAVLRDLDMSVLERSVLDDLLRLGTSVGSIKEHDEAVDGLREHLADWILAREASPIAPKADGTLAVTHPTLRLRRLRALLHLVDSDVGGATEDGVHAARLRERWRKIAGALAVRFEREPPSMLHRTISAALARALDALVRAGACDLNDVLLVVAKRETDPAEFETLAEASMDPDLIHVLLRYARFLRACREQAPPSVAPDSLDPSSVSSRSWTDRKAVLSALEELGAELVPDGSGAREALRTVLVRLCVSLAAVAWAPHLAALCTSGGTEPDTIASLEMYLGALGQLSAGARARIEPSAAVPGASAPPLDDQALSLAVSRVLAGADPELSEPIVGKWVADLEGRIPVGIARVVEAVVRGLLEKPVEASRSVIPLVHSTSAGAIPLVRGSDTYLPAWLPARRTIGGFYVLRSLGQGAVGSVFIVVRTEDRHDENAERFALKVPDYSATAARSLSEAEFLKLFRAEASALMQVPQHANLARFVTFDLGARPKPILVMELVEGALLERVIASRTFDVPRALVTLDDVLAGLEAMHGVGVGHLDVKPSNVVMRKGQEAVLVDFGLAGRHVRPGCATGPYGAPEVWGVVPDKYEPQPPPADLYAFGCLAFEVLTGRVLFDASNEVAQIGLHVAHDGLPAPLAELGQRPGLKPLVELLQATLRRDPRKRPTAPDVRALLRRVAPEVAKLSWPLGAS